MSYLRTFIAFVLAIARSSAREQFEQVAIGNMKVDAAAALAIIQLAVGGTPGLATPGDPSFLDTLKDRIEFAIANMKRVMMRLERLGVIKV